MNNIWKVEELSVIGQKRAMRFGLKGISIDEAAAEFASEVWLAMQRVDKERDGATTYLWRRGIGAIKDYIKKGVKQGKRHVSGDAVDAEGVSLWDCIGTETEAPEQRERKEILTRAMAVLTTEEKSLVIAIYKEEKSLVEIAAEKGISKQAVDKQRNKAVERMKRVA